MTVLTATLGAAAGAAPSPTPAAAPGPSARPAGFKVVGYFPSWEGDVAAIQWKLLTHVNFAFVLPTRSGALVPNDTLDRLAPLVRAAHANHVSVSIAVGGWHDGDDSAFEHIARHPDLRRTFVRNLLAFVDRHGFDGVDIDWEYPDAGASARGYLALMQELRARLAPQGKLLTTAVVGDGKNAEGIPREVFAIADFVNIMAYDADEGENHLTHHSPYEYAETCLRFWRGRGLPKDKAILGVPFYGKNPGTSYRALVERDKSAPDKDQLGGIYYNGTTTMKRKTALARAEGGGVMIWEISGDTSDATSLLRAIDEAARR